MTRLMDDNQELAIVFGRTKRRVDELTRGLKDSWLPEQKGIHGWIKTNVSEVLRDFKNERTSW